MERLTFFTKMFTSRHTADYAINEYLDSLEEFGFVLQDVSMSHPEEGATLVLVKAISESESKSESK